MLDHLIGNEDADAVKALERAFKKRGIAVAARRARDRASRSRDGGSRCATRARTGATRASRPMSSSSRPAASPNVEDIGLEAAGVEYDQRRGVIGRPPHAHERAAHLRRRRRRRATGSSRTRRSARARSRPRTRSGTTREIDYRSTPRCVYTDPEVASVGLTEAAGARAHGDDVVVGTMPVRGDRARARCTATAPGFVKMIGETRYGELLGMVVVGTQATELIEAGVVGDRGRGDARDRRRLDRRAPDARRGRQGGGARRARPAAPHSAGAPASEGRRGESRVDASRILIPTLRDDPADAEAISHQLLVRGGFVRQVGAGLCTWLPLGWRGPEARWGSSARRWTRIGGQEMLMPVLHPAEIWKRTGRYDIDVALQAARTAPTATTCSRSPTRRSSRCTPRETIRRYRDLPQIWYHIQIKERDEPRPQGGVLRTREFTMKDSYTLDRDQAGLDEGYAKHEEAYDRIFERCGLDVLQGRVRHRHDGRLRRRTSTWRQPPAARTELVARARAATTPRTSRWPRRGRAAPSCRRRSTRRSRRSRRRT